MTNTEKEAIENLLLVLDASEKKTAPIRHDMKIVRKMLDKEYSK